MFGVATYFLFLFLKRGKLSKNKNPLMTPVRKKWFAKLDFWVWESGYLSGRYLIWGSTPLGSESDLYWWIGYIGAYGSKIGQLLPRATWMTRLATLIGIRNAQEINSLNKVAHLRSLVVRCEKMLVNKHKHTIYANSKFTKIPNHDQTICMQSLGFT